MIVAQGLDALRSLPAGATVSVGNFDGLHLGHQRILYELAAADTHGGERVVVTFEPHPLTVLKPELAPPRLTTPAQKQALLAGMDVHRVIELPPSPEVLGMSAEQFYETLRDHARIARLVEGVDFNFGKARRGTIDTLRAWCARDHMQLTVVSDVSTTLSDRSVVPVSSSLVRWLIAHGRVIDAALCLGRPYAIEGIVVKGEQRGRTIGFPTANLDVGDAPLLAGGVYAARARVDGHNYAVALSVGTKPTFTGKRVAVEAYLLNFAGDLYGKTLSLDVVDWVRDQQSFPSLDALVAQVGRDVERVRLLVG